MILIASALAQDCPAPTREDYVGHWAGGGTGALVLAPDGTLLTVDAFRTFGAKGSDPAIEVGTWSFTDGGVVTAEGSPPLAFEGCERDTWLTSSRSPSWEPLSEDTVKAWAAAWSGAKTDFDSYGDWYGWDAFKSGEVHGADAWLADKKTKVTKAECLEVRVDDVRIVDAHKAVFTQTYVSDRYCDVGEKTLTFFPMPARWVIVEETQPTAEPCPERCKP